MLPWLGRPGNPSSLHWFGREAALAVDVARAQVAAACRWHRDGVVFTSGATEGNATVLTTGRWLVSAVEHPSVRAFAAATLPVDSAGRVLLPDDAGGCDGVSVMFANNETGVIQPIAEVIAWARQRGLRVHIDAAQALGRVDFPKIDADFITVSAHKHGGPQGVGAVLVRRGLRLVPLLRGGPQERGQRAGTHHVAGIVGAGAAAEAARPMAPTLRDRLEAGLVALGGRVAGAGAERLPNTCCVGFDGLDAADLAMALDLEGVAVSAGAACASGSSERSPVLIAMGFEGTALRFSLGHATTAAEVDTALGHVSAVLARVRGGE